MKQSLPNRRQSMVMEFETSRGNATIPFTAILSFDPKNNLKEVFLKSGKIGSDQFVLMHETSVILSQLLRYGAKPKEILKSLPRTSETDKPEGPIGTLLEILIKEEANA